MAILIAVVISIGGLVEIIPLMASASMTEPYEGITPYPAPSSWPVGTSTSREGCYVCHSQQIRPFRSETERYGPYSVAGEARLRSAASVRLEAHRAGPWRASVGGTATNGIACT